MGCALLGLGLVALCALLGLGLVAICALLGLVLVGNRLRLRRVVLGTLVAGVRPALAHRGLPHARCGLGRARACRRRDGRGEVAVLSLLVVEELCIGGVDV